MLQFPWDPSLFHMSWVGSLFNVLPALMCLMIEIPCLCLELRIWNSQESIPCWNIFLSRGTANKWRWVLTKRWGQRGWELRMRKWGRFEMQILLEVLLLNLRKKHRKAYPSWGNNSQCWKTLVTRNLLLMFNYVLLLISICWFRSWCRGNKE